MSIPNNKLNDLAILEKNIEQALSALKGYPDLTLQMPSLRQMIPKASIRYGVTVNNALVQDALLNALLDLASAKSYLIKLREQLEHL